MFKIYNDNIDFLSGFCLMNKTEIYRIIKWQANTD